MVIDNPYISNLAFLLSYGDGTSNDEIEYEIYKIAFQQREDTHYDRMMGGAFEDFEQENSNKSETLALLFSTYLIQSIYLLNVERNFNPYIIVGFSDISTEIIDSTFYMNISYRLLSDMSVTGTVKLEI